MESPWIAHFSISDGAWGVVGISVGALLMYFLKTLPARRDAQAAHKRAIAAQIQSETRAKVAERDAALRKAYIQLLAWAEDFVGSSDLGELLRAPKAAVATVELDGPESIKLALRELQVTRLHPDQPAFGSKDAAARVALSDEIKKSQVPDSVPRDV